MLNLLAVISHWATSRLGVITVMFFLSARKARISGAVVPPSMKITSPSLTIRAAALPIDFFSVP